MERREMRQLAKMIAEEIWNLSNQYEEDFIGIDEICRLTGMSQSAVYHRRVNGMPVQRSGNKLIAKKSEINNWLKTR